VMTDGRFRKMESVSNVAGCARAVAQHFQYGAAGRIIQGFEESVQEGI